MLLVAAAALVQLLPAAAAFHPPLLPRLYGLAPQGPTEELLLRHRAVLLGLVGLALLAGLRAERLLPTAIAFGLLSKLSYLALYAVTRGPTAEVARVARVDAVTSALLVLAAVLLLRARA
jgi:hypothetical protein